MNDKKPSRLEIASLIMAQKELDYHRMTSHVRTLEAINAAAKYSLLAAQALIEADHEMSSSVKVKT